MCIFIIDNQQYTENAHSFGVKTSDRQLHFQPLVKPMSRTVTMKQQHTARNANSDRHDISLLAFSPPTSLVQCYNAVTF